MNHFTCRPGARAVNRKRDEDVPHDDLPARTGRILFRSLEVAGGTEAAVGVGVCARKQAVGNHAA